jgi:hypothetical protein
MSNFKLEKWASWSTDTYEKLDKNRLKISSDFYNGKLYKNVRCMTTHTLLFNLKIDKKSTPESISFI